MATLAFGMSAWSSHLFGIPTFPAWTNGVFSASLNGPNKSFWERVAAFYLEALDYFVMRPGYVRHARPRLLGCIRARSSRRRWS